MSDGGQGRPRVLPLRAAAFVGRTLRGEWQGIVVDPLRQLRRRGPFALSLAFLAAGGVIFFHDLAQRPTGALVVWRLGGVMADLPLWLALLRTPVSLYVPALDLPVWAGITQLFLAFALAELALGRARTLAVAYATTLAGTLMVRVMIALGPGWWGLGLPPETGQVLDTGPSAAVVGLFTYLSVVRRAPVVFTLTGGSMVWESIAVPNLAGREHLIAVTAAIVLGLLHGHRPRWARLPLRRPPARTGTLTADGSTPAGVGPGAMGAEVPAGAGKFTVDADVRAGEGSVATEVDAPVGFETFTADAPASAGAGPGASVAAADAGVAASVAAAGVGVVAVEAAAGVGVVAVEAAAGVGVVAVEAAAGVGVVAVEAAADAGVVAVEAAADAGVVAVEAAAGVGVVAVEAAAGAGPVAADTPADAGALAVEAGARDGGRNTPADAPAFDGPRGERSRTPGASSTPPSALDPNPPASPAPLPEPDAPPAVSPTRPPSSSAAPAAPAAPAASAEPPGSPDLMSDGRCGPILN
ncbi:hypothetical protein ACWEKM_38465 [Streptomyces sp. NPDC004752]